MGLGTRRLLLLLLAALPVPLLVLLALLAPGAAAAGGSRPPGKAPWEKGGSGERGEGPRGKGVSAWQDPLLLGGVIRFVLRSPGCRRAERQDPVARRRNPAGERGLGRARGASGTSPGEGC